MCPHCEDFARTVAMLGQLALYAHTDGADQDFIEAVGPSLAASLPDFRWSVRSYPGFQVALIGQWIGVTPQGRDDARGGP